ncbi:MAG: bifunctional diguanylate cyclase/phosphodiesterase, partial [Pseudomonadota bacterium]
GHSIGDRLLQDLAKRLNRTLNQDRLAARLGGDEFAVLVNSSTMAEEALTYACDLLDHIREPFSLAEHKIQVDASIGIAFFPEHAQDVEMLIQCADIAMYQAKRARSGFAVYDAVADTHSKRRLALIADIREAIGKEQFYLRYQPKINLHDVSLAGVEALLRWNHPHFGEISPAEFVPMAEENGCIDEMTLTIVKMSLDQYSKWQELGLHIPIAINLSSRSLQKQSFTSALLDIVEPIETYRRAISFELTESVSINEDPKVLNNLKKLHDRGFEIALDDFGTGYSSFAYLRHLPIDTLKVDRAFLQVPRNEQNDDDVMRGIIDLGHKLELKTVAEGVEDHETMLWLREIGCDVAQGFYLGYPMLPDAIASWPSGTLYFEDVGEGVTPFLRLKCPTVQEPELMPT